MHGKRYWLIVHKFIFEALKWNYVSISNIFWNKSNTTKMKPTCIKLTVEESISLGFKPNLNQIHLQYFSKNLTKILNQIYPNKVSFYIQHCPKYSTNTAVRLEPLLLSKKQKNLYFISSLAAALNTVLKGKRSRMGTWLKATQFIPSPHSMTLLFFYATSWTKG